MSVVRNFWADRRGKLALGAAVLAVLLIGVAVAYRSGQLTKTPEEILSGQQPHRAVYDLSLGRMKSGSDVQDVSGRMVVEWRGGPACDGYSSEQRIVTRVADADGSMVSDDTRVTTWESADGKEFHFDRSEYVNGELRKQESGVARRSEDGKQVILEKDGAKPVSLPGEMMFPTAFNNRLAVAAEKDKNRMSALLFDGTEDKASVTTAFIGKRREASPDAVKVKIENAQFGKPIKDKKAWPVRLSYFDHMDPDGMPSFQMGFLLFRNSVSSQLLLEYQDVTMKGDLIGIEYFKPGSC